MPSRAVLPRILGALFYYPQRPEVKALFDWFRQRCLELPPRRAIGDL